MPVEEPYIQTSVPAYSLSRMRQIKSQRYNSAEDIAKWQGAEGGYVVLTISQAFLAYPELQQIRTDASVGYSAFLARTH